MKAPPSIGGQSVKAVIDTRAEVTVYVAQISDDVLLSCDIIDDLIAPSIQDRSSWANPVVLDWKKDKTVHWCIDFRRLIDNGVEKVSAYGSKKLDQHQQRYSVTRKELFAVFTFINQYRHYLLGARFVLRTDHGSLQWLLNFKDPQGQVARWLEVLSRYNFEIKQRAGKNTRTQILFLRKNVEGTTDATCQQYLETEYDWDNFRIEVDDIATLVKVVVTHGHFDSIRTVTKSQTKHIPSSKVNVTSWFTGYTSKEIEALQRKDTYLGRLHKWKDPGTFPTRDQVVTL
ncbi:Hypothetical predicted protein [Mytilus galloprovincialis]|uniref:Reverse transcriptase RNase H-like domain-containing protein n=1 Tax=Mytilus galloprovincialis TaxID=29158 RepID=A0A8B6G9P5_MYTGA|nr:Hypothetical predicted protein [Mytilus galloprovincialis]